MKTASDSLRQFDDLPDSANIRVGVVATVLGVSVGTVWRYARAGIIPSPRKIGPRVTAWSVGDIRRHLAASAGQ